jgi:hypothetical protein
MGQLRFSVENAAENSLLLLQTNSYSFSKSMGWVARLLQKLPFMMPRNYNELLQQLDMGTVAQNIGFYSLITLMILVICVQHSVLNQRKNKR